MSDNETQETSTNTKEEQPDNTTHFSLQPTGLVETTFAETLGLSMHNAIVNQQSSQMTTSASITNACARLLKTPIPVPLSPSKEHKESELNEGQPETENLDPSEPTKRFKIGNFFKDKKKKDPMEEKNEN